jgi:hypothetical protein
MLSTAKGSLQELINRYSQSQDPDLNYLISTLGEMHQQSQRVINELAAQSQQLRSAAEIALSYVKEEMAIAQKNNQTLDASRYNLIVSALAFNS